MSEQARRIIVTGGAGFIGSALVRALVADGAAVLCIDRLTYAGELSSLGDAADRENFRFLKADIRDRSAMAAALAEFRPHVVYHLAAESHVDRSIDGPREFVDTNIVGTFVLLETARDYLEKLHAAERERFRFVHVSTDEVFGSASPDSRFSETSPYDPSSPYSASKAASDHIVLAWHRTFGVPAILTNASNNYGPYQFPEKLIPLMIINAIERKPLPVYGQGVNVRDWMHVDDHVRALRLIAGQGRAGSRYNIGSGNERRNLDVVAGLCAALDSRIPGGAPHADLMEFVEDRPGHDLRYAIDAARLREELGWRPQIGFEQGLESTVDWYLDNRWWWQPLRGQRYAGERQGLQVGRAAPGNVGQGGA